MSIMRLHRCVITEHGSCAELSAATLAVLSSLARHGDMTIGELARLEHVRPPTMTRKVDELESDGHVARQSHPADGRVVMVGLTGLGRAKAEADRVFHNEWLAHQLKALTAQERAVLRGVAPILQRLSDVSESASERS